MTEMKKIEELVQQELKEANEIHPAFASDHEAYAVILEELEECIWMVFVIHSMKRKIKNI